MSFRDDCLDNVNPSQTAPDADTLTPRQRRAMAALLACASVAAAARAAGISERTLTRWRRIPAFRSELRQASYITVDATTAQLRALGEQAVAVLREALTDESAAIRTRAATAVVKLIYQIGDDELAQRVEALESAAAIISPM